MYKHGEHGLADILLGPQRPCGRSTINTGQCVCDGTSYFPQIRPAPYPCGTIERAQLYVTHPKNKMIIPIQDCSGPDRMDCLNGNVCLCNGDCPPGMQCSCISNTCIKIPEEERPQNYDLSYQQGNNNTTINSMEIYLGLFVILGIIAVYFL